MRPTNTTTVTTRTRQFVAHFSTSGKIETVESWLARHAKPGWSLQTEGVSDDLLTKKYRINFVEKADYEGFRARFTRPSDR